jgi:RNA polymerase sigma-70 factor (ECF subfamily)
MDTKDDNELVYEVIHCSISSFEILIDRYQKTVFNIMLRSTGETETAKDLTQDVFVKAFENMGRFNFRYRFFSWLYRMAINEAISHNRKHHFVHVHGTMEPTAPEEPGQSSGTERGKLLHKAIRSLTDEYRTLVLLK